MTGQIRIAFRLATGTISNWDNTLREAQLVPWRVALIAPFQTEAISAAPEQFLPALATYWPLLVAFLMPFFACRASFSRSGAEDRSAGWQAGAIAICSFRARGRLTTKMISRLPGGSTYVSGVECAYQMKLRTWGLEYGVNAPGAPGEAFRD
jgi:hypothetical protein